MSSFDPNGVGVANGNFLALPCEAEEAQLVLIPVTWDVTTSYRPGTSNGPQAIIDASIQLDLYDADAPDAWDLKIYTQPIDPSILELNNSLRPIAESIIDFLADGGEIDDPNIQDHLAKINQSSILLNDFVESNANTVLSEERIPALIGGDHSTPLGLIRALCKRYPNMGILHIDAHADLREAYEGFTYSHASIMYNVLNEANPPKLVQVGIRDYCQAELDLIQSNPKIVTFFDTSLYTREFEGEPWSKTCDQIVSELPSEVYISFDIDGLSPELCPNTGTPVPGGLSYRKAEYLLKKLAFSGKKIRGFDLNEVSPDPNGDEWDANVGARILQKLCNLTLRNNQE